MSDEVKREIKVDDKVLVFRRRFHWLTFGLSENTTRECMVLSVARKVDGNISCAKVCDLDPHSNKRARWISVDDIFGLIEDR